MERRGASKDDVGQYSDPEKRLSVSEEFAPVTADSKFQFNAADLDRVQRRLTQRHVQMYGTSLIPSVEASY